MTKMEWSVAIICAGVMVTVEVGKLEANRHRQWLWVGRVGCFRSCSKTR